jgi:hypothetical protein
MQSSFLVSTVAAPLPQFNRPSRVFMWGAGLVLGAALFGLPATSALAQKAGISIDDVKLESPDFKDIFGMAPKPVLKGVTKIAIPVFTVETVVKTGAGIRQESSSGSVTQEVTYILEGVPQKEMQAAVDKLYDDLVADLKTAGIEVVPQEQIKETAAYKAAALTAVSPALHTGSGAEVMVYAAKGVALGLSNSRFMFMRGASGGGGGGLGGTIGNVMAAASVIGSLTSQVGDAKVAGAIAEELGVPTLTVQVPLEFVEQKGKGTSGFWGGNASAEISSRLRLSIAVNTFVSATYKGEFSVLNSGVPLILSGTPVKAVKDTSSIAANVGLAVFAMAIGSKASKKMTEKTAEADPEKYVANVADGVGKFNKIVLSAVKAMQ